MIKARLWNDETDNWGDFFRLDGYKQMPQVDNRFDESFSTATFNAYTNDIKGITPAEVWTKCELILDSEHFIGFVSNYTDETVVFGKKLRGNRLATFELVELVAVTQYMPMSNLCFTNEIVSEIDNTTGAVTTDIKTKKAYQVVQRIANQIYNLPYGSETPFEMRLPPSDAWWYNIVMPELNFTDVTLFDCLVGVGEAIGGFPYLTLIAGGVYEIDFRQWDNKNVAYHTVENASSIVRSATIENQGFMIDSTVQNMLSVSPSGDNATVFPALDKFKGVSGEDYITEIVAKSATIKLNNRIQKIVKVEINIPGLRGEITDPYNYFIDITFMLIEGTVWQTLHNTAVDVTSYADLKTAYKNNRLYYKYNENEIYNIDDVAMIIGWYYKKLNGQPQATPGYPLDSRDIIFRITYIPISTTRVITYQEGAVKPIGQPYNQQSNIISAGAYGNNLQGLVNRIHGKETKVLHRIKRGGIPYHIGEFLNGEVISEALNEYTPTEIISTYTTSPNFNRRTQYIKLPHAQRQWEIPAGDKVTDRNLLYTEEIQCSIGTPCEQSNGIITDAAINQYLINYDTAQNKPNLAYIAWKSRTEINADIDVEDSRNYALATLTSVPIGRAISFHFEAADNASMGSRTYKFFNGDETSHRLLQQFISYGEKAEYLCVQMSNTTPQQYNFSDTYTGTGKEGGYNTNFQYTFPLSNKQQWSEANSLANFFDCKIEKDLSERILFTYLLNFVGKNDTIVYEHAAILNSLCNSNAVSGFKVWLSADEKYGFWDKVGKGTPFTATFTKLGMANRNGHVQFTFNFTGNYSSIGITDNDNNLLFASNKAGSGGVVDLYMSNRRKEWKKI